MQDASSTRPPDPSPSRTQQEPGRVHVDVESVAGEEDPGASIDVDVGAPGTPGTGESVCTRCDGTGRIGQAPCPNCRGTGKVNLAIGGA